MSQPRKGKAHTARVRRKAEKRKTAEAKVRRDRAYKRAKANVKTARRQWRNRGKGRRK